MLQMKEINPQRRHRWLKKEKEVRSKWHPLAMSQCNCLLLWHNAVSKHLLIVCIIRGL